MALQLTGIRSVRGGRLRNRDAGELRQGSRLQARRGLQARSDGALNRPRATAGRDPEEFAVSAEVGLTERRHSR